MTDKNFNINDRRPIIREEFDKYKAANVSNRLPFDKDTLNKLLDHVSNDEQDVERTKQGNIEFLTHYQTDKLQEKSQPSRDNGAKIGQAKPEDIKKFKETIDNLDNKEARDKLIAQLKESTDAKQKDGINYQDGPIDFGKKLGNHQLSKGNRELQNQLLSHDKTPSRDQPMPGINPKVGDAAIDAPDAGQGVHENYVKKNNLNQIKGKPNKKNDKKTVEKDDDLEF